MTKASTDRRAPVDLAAPIKPNVGKTVCPAYAGSGIVTSGVECEDCGGTGIVIAGVCGG